MSVENAAAIAEEVAEHLEEVVELEQLPTIELAEETLGRDLMQVLLQEIRALPDVWPKLSENRQAGVIDRVRAAVDSTVRRTVKILAARDLPAISGVLESVAIKEGIKATFKVSQFDPLRHELIDQTGKVCMLVVATHDDYTAAMSEIKPDPDQHGLDLVDEEEELQGDLLAGDSTSAHTFDGNEAEQFEQSRRLVVVEQRASVSFLQSHLAIGEELAHAFLKRLEAEGVVGEENELGGRAVFWTESDLSKEE